MMTMNTPAMKALDLTPPDQPAPTLPVEMTPATVEVPARTTVEGPRAVTPWDLLARAQAQGADMASLRQFMDLAERHEANEAKKAFNQAFADFKTEAIKIVRNKTVTDGPLKGKRYAELFSFVDAVTPALKRPVRRSCCERS